MIRLANKEDIPAVAEIYDHILSEEERGNARIGWVRGIYPTEQTARAALEKGVLYVLEEDGRIKAAAKIDQEQVPEYADAKWENLFPDDKILVLHTLVAEPSEAGKGYGKSFVEFYEALAKSRGCAALRIDTNEINEKARRLYKRLGYREAGIVHCNFNGIENVRLVCLEKKI